MSNYLYYYKERTENFYTFEMVPEPINLKNIKNSVNNNKANNTNKLGDTNKTNYNNSNTRE